MSEVTDNPTTSPESKTIRAMDHSLAIGGNARDVYFNNNGQPTAKTKDLERGYLNWLQSECRAVSMSPFSAGGSDEPGLQLEAVYTALLTTMQQHTDDRKTHIEHNPKKQKTLSAVELLNEEPRLVLQGGPGSGKSTFVNYLALCLAGKYLGNTEVNLQALTQPLPDEDGDDQEERQAWNHPFLLPIKIILRDFAASACLPATAGEATAEHLWRFIEQQLEKSAKTALVPYLKQRLNQATANVLLMLDGLDEVAEAAQRRQQVRAVIQAFADAHPGCRVLVTCRPYAYEKPQWQLQGFASGLLADFSAGQIRRFIDRWYAKGNLDASDATGRAGLLKALIFRRDGERLLTLARRPLLLTMMAHLHADKKRDLPEKRGELYEEVTTLLLETWEKRRYKVDDSGAAVLAQESLSEYLRVGPGVIRFALEKMAYQVHKSQLDAQGTADIPSGQLYEILAAVTNGDKDIKPQRVQEYLCDRCGILHERGNEVYTFPHRSFQEYLAACYLNREEAELINDAGEEREFAEFVAELGRNDPDRWREVVLLAGLKAAAGNAGPAWDLAEALCSEAPPPKSDIHDEDAWGARLAGQLIVEATNPAVAKRQKARIRDTIRDWQLSVMRGSSLPARERCAAGENLAELGDSRFDPENHFLLNESLLGFIRVPAGRFNLGSDQQEDREAHEDETPQHALMLPQYYMARYPVSVAQFRHFVNDSGYGEVYEQSLTGLDNQPMAWVSGHDAIAYCAWLQQKLIAQARQRLSDSVVLSAEQTAFWRGLVEDKLAVTLPSEPEWEKAARGEQGLIYPWGQQCDPDKANYHQTEWGQTSAVGCFPQGKSPYGCEEMSGNVREWTRSVRDSYPYPQRGQALQQREAMQGNDPRVLRGGAFYDDSGYVRGACRLNLHPNNRFSNIGFRVVVSPFTLDDDNSER